MSDFGSQEDLRASGGTDDKGRRLPPLDSGIELTGRAVPQQTLASAKDDHHGRAFDRTRRDEEIAWGSRTGLLADDWVEAETLLAGATGQGSPMREQGGQLPGYPFSRRGDSSSHHFALPTGQLDRLHISSTDGEDRPSHRLLSPIRARGSELLDYDSPQRQGESLHRFASPTGRETRSTGPDRPHKDVSSRHWASPTRHYIDRPTRDWGGQNLGYPHHLRETAPVERGTNRKPPNFDGKSSFGDFRVQFEIVAKMNGWSQGRCAMEMAASLRDQAVSVLTLLDPDMRGDYRALVDALESRFEPRHQTEMHRASLRNRTRKRGESLSALALDLKGMTRRAYPTARGELWEQLTVTSFLDSLADGDMEWAVLQGRPTTVEEAVTLATQFESFKKARSRRRAKDEPELYLVQEKTNAKDNTTKDKDNRRKCYFCNSPLHLIENCAERIEGLRRTQPQAQGRNRKSGNEQ